MKKMKIKLNKAMFKVKAHSPEILMVVGIAGAVGSTVLACRATLKSKQLLDERKATLDEINSLVEDTTVTEEQYSVEDANTDIKNLNIQTGVKIALQYAPSVVLGVASIGCMVGSHRIMRKRNAALTIAYATIDKSYKEYRQRVAEKYGNEAEEEIRYGIKAQEYTETVKNAKGKEKTITKKIDISECPGSTYSRYFIRPYTTEQTDDIEYDETFVRAQQRYANDLLVSRGYLYLNEVYHALGFENTREGQIVGWVYDPENPNIDSSVDFGIKRVNRQDENGKIQTVLALDFNVDGNIWDKMA